MIPANLLKNIRLACLSTVILTIMLNHSNAEIPSLLNYQGQVTNSGTGEPLDSIVSIVFSIYDDSVTATPLWTETYTSIAVVDGLFAVLLGSQNPVPESIFGDAERWLGIKVGADSEIAPRTRFVSAAYSFHSLYADSAGTGDDGDWTDDGGGNIYRLSGNIGIGTTSPTFKVDVRTPDDLNDGFRLSAGPYNIISTQNGGVQLKPYPSDWADAVLIQNYGSGGVARTQIMTTSSMGENGRPNLTYPHLSLQPNGGNVGIGTTSPAKKLQVNASATDAALRLHAPAGDNNRPTPYLLFTGGYRTNNGAAISGKNDQIFGQTALSFYAGWNTSTHGDDPGIGDLYERMRIASNGNVGIGTTGPNTKLEISNAGGSQEGGLRLVNTDALAGGAGGTLVEYFAGATLIGKVGFGGENGTNANFDVYQIVEGTFTNTPVFRIQKGNVGIGTTMPNEQLEITKNFRLPASAATAGTATAGVIFSDGNRYIHNFGTSNFFAGVNAGNLTMSGESNTGVGLAALRDNAAGHFNTAVGTIALHGNTTGNSNTASGFGALNFNRTGDNNTALGFDADVSATDLTNATAIGANTVVNASNKVRIGDTLVTVIEGQVDWSFISDSTKKENFLQTDGEMVLRKLRNFRLTSWNYKGHDPATRRHYGPMAQDFFAAFGRDDIGIVGTDTTLTGSDVSGINMIAIQALEKRTAEQEKIISAQDAELQRLKKQLDSFEGIKAELAQLQMALQSLARQKLSQEKSAKVKKASVAVKANALQTGTRE